MERTGKELLVASKRFAEENRLTSWWVLFSTLTLLTAAITLACASLPIWVNICASFLAGLLLIRTFIIYHDYMHGAILQKSKFAHAIMYVFGLMILSPTRLWKHNHDTHHKNNCKSFGAELGEFPIMTTENYAKATFWQRMGYRVVRNPLIILFGYVTSFLLNKPLYDFIRHPIKRHEGAVALAAHFGVAIVVGIFSIKALVLGMMVPVVMATMIGTYLFYAQHNFPGMKRREGQEWDYVHAALSSSSFMKMSPLMHWFTGNIGYHHVHHLNSKIPFYRLPEAMAALSELQTPIETSLRPIDVYRCLRLKLWDPVDEKLLSFREAAQLQERAQAA